MSKIRGIHSRTLGRPLRLASILLSLVVLAVSTAGTTPAQDTGAVRVRAAVARLDTLGAQALQRSGVPGMAVAVVYQDAVVYLGGFGVREAGTGQPVDADTVFQLASVSKPVASTVVAALAGDGVVSWDDPVVEHDPAFQMYDPWVTRQVTLRDLFAHRSGLPNHAGDLLEDMGYDRAEVLYRLRYQKPDSSFRSTYHYTNFGLTEAAVAAARAAGQSWEDVSATRLYAPLGMTSTSSRFADFAAALNHAPTHVLVDGRYEPRYVRDPDAQSPAGGVSSTVRDLTRWMRLQIGSGSVDGRPIVAADPLNATHLPQMVSNQPRNPTLDRAGFYGLGWNVSYDERGRVRLSHSGGFALGAATTVSLIPAEQLGIVVLTNAAPIGVPEILAATFLDLALEGRVTRDWAALIAPLFVALAQPEYGREVDYAQPPAGAQPPLLLARYVGTYENDLYGPVEIAAAGDGLALRQGPRLTAFPLRHYDRDTFSYQPVGENAAGPSGVTFQIGPAQTATTVTIEILDVNHQGAFTRANPDR